MNKLMLIIVATGITACSSIPVDVLKTPNGNGALAIATSFLKSSGTYPCHKFYLDMYEQSDNLELSSKSIKLNFFPDVKKDYILFDDIKPGSYVITSLRCFPKPGYVFNTAQLSHLSLDIWSEQVIKENKITLSREGFAGRDYEDGTFSFKFKNTGNNTGLLKLIIDEASITGWSFHESPDYELPIYK